MSCGRRLGLARVNAQAYADDAVHGESLNRMSNFKYPGCILTDDLRDGADMERAMSEFYESFGILFRKFTHLMLNTFSIYFSFFCTSFYGADLWVNRKKCLNVFKNLCF